MTSATRITPEALSASTARRAAPPAGPAAPGRRGRTTAWNRSWNVSRRTARPTAISTYWPNPIAFGEYGVDAEPCESPALTVARSVAGPSRMARLLLGPILRHVGETDATVWVETDQPCTVAVLGCRARTFQVSGHHYALVRVEGLARGSTQEDGVE